MILSDLGSMTLVQGDLDVIRAISERCNLGGSASIDTRAELYNSMNVCSDYFSRTEIFLARTSLKKGVGSIGLNNEHLRKFPKCKLDLGFQLIFNIFFHYSFWPRAWRTCYIFPLKKAGRRDFSNPVNYRGISNVDTCGKFLEGIIFHRLSHLLLDSISECQGGGLQNRGAIQTLIRVSEQINCYRSQDDFDAKGRSVPTNFVCLALLDISKAFDKLDRRVIIDKLYDLGVRGRLLVFVIGYFYDRKQCVRVGESESTFVTTHNGGPQGSVITLFCFLLYINDICDHIQESEFALFMDDLALIIHDTSSKNLVSRLNADFNRILGWSVFNRVIFDSKKFHLLDIGVLNLSKQDKSSVCFGDTYPEWSHSAKYLGVILDDKFTFLDAIRSIICRIEGSMWRLYNHGNISKGSSPFILLNIFRIWLLPLFDYGSCLWVFLVFDGNVEVDRKPSQKYRSAFSKLESLYVKCCKIILGVPSSSSSVGVLVRLGLLPLRFHYVWRALVWYLKAYNGSASMIVQRQLNDFYCDDEIWYKSCFYNHAFRKLSYLSSISGVNFWVLNNSKKSSKLIRDALFSEANIYWGSFPGNCVTKAIHPEWKFLRFNRVCHSRFTSSVYHSCAVGRGKFNGFLHKISASPSPFCRLGCGQNSVEDLQHVFFDCLKNKEKIDKLKEKFKEKKIDYNVQNLFSENKMQIDVERFLYEFFA